MRAILRGIVLLLVILGTAAAAGRAIWTGDLAAYGEGVRTYVFQYLHIHDANTSRSEEVREFESRYGAHPLMITLHVLPGGAFLVLATLQFSSRLRNRRIEFHRWNGRILILIAFLCVPAGLYFSLRMPFGGMGEVIATLLFGAIFLAALARAFIAIRKHQVDNHREWMIRAFAIALGISTVRIVSMILDLTMSPFGYSSRQVFVYSLWIGWPLSLAAAELWIRFTRVRSDDFSRHELVTTKVVTTNV